MVEKPKTGSSSGGNETVARELGTDDPPIMVAVRKRFRRGSTRDG